MKEYAFIRGAVAALEKNGPARELFGANAHQYRFHAPLSEEAVTDFERKHDVRLPKDYRGFLIEVGNGGAGPYYGVFKLGEMDDLRECEPWKEGEFVGVLRNPWPHRGPWNLSQAELDVPEDLSDDEEDARIEEVDRKYYDEALVAGAFPICHHGCALRDWLVVTGPDAGQVWHDARADQGGLRPCERADGRRLTFLDWYLDWLNDAVRKFGIKLP